LKKVSFRTILLTCLLALCSLWLTLWVIRVVQNIGAPQIEYSEGFNTYLARLFATGQWSWSLSSTPPFNVSFYTPIGFYVLGFVNRVFGESLIVGRSLNLFYTVGCLTIVYLIVWNQTKDKLVSILAAVLPLTSVTLIAWSFFIRVDLLATFLDLLGVFIVLKYWKTNKVYWAIPIFLLAFYTKQSALAGAVASCLYLLIKGKDKGWIFTIIYCILFAVIFAIFQIATYGDFLKEILLYQRTSPAIRNPVDSFLTLAVSLTMYLPITVMAFTWLKDNFKQYLGIFALSALVINGLTLLHPGGNINYLFETIFAFSISAGIWLATADITEKNLNVIISSGIYLIIMLAGGALGMLGESFPSQQYRIEYQQAVTIISDATYPILTENASMVLDAGQVPYDEPFVFNNLARLGYFDENILLNDLATKKIQYVVTQFMLPNVAVRRFDMSVQNAIIDNYHIVLNATTDKSYSFVVWKAN
jgi:hypothetical protein